MYHFIGIKGIETKTKKVISFGRMVNYPKSFYGHRCTAIESKRKQAAIILSYSGRATFLPSIVEILHSNMLCDKNL